MKYPVIKNQKEIIKVSKKRQTRVAVMRTTATEMQRFLSKIIVIIVKRISMYLVL